MSLGMEHLGSGDAHDTDAELDRVVDTRGVSYAQARAILAGSYPQRDALRDVSRRNVRPSIDGRSYNHRGGKGLGEPTAAEAEEGNWNAPIKLSEAQLAINLLGLQRVRQAYLEAMRAIAGQVDHSLEPEDANTESLEPYIEQELPFEE